MCNTPLHAFLAALPKAEHHMHLEGSLEPELLFELAAKNRITLPLSSDAAFASPASLRARYEAFQNLDDFLGYYYIGMSVLVDAADFEALAYAYFAKAASQGVRHAEVFFDPQAHTDRGVELATIVGSVRKAQDRAEADFGLSSELIMCLLRHLPLSSALETFKHANDAGYFKDGTLAAIGMDSSEKPFPPPLWKDLFAAAEGLGIRRTIHAGEEGPPLYVTQSLDVLHAQRIDHGVRALTEGDDALVARLVASKTLLTMCPISNVKLNCIPSIAAFPLRRLIEIENYCALQDVFDLSVREWETIAKGSIAGSWCSEERKAQLFLEIDDVVHAYVMENEEQ